MIIINGKEMEDGNEFFIQISDSNNDTQVLTLKNLHGTMRCR
jgi:hypothetical protein